MTRGEQAHCAKRERDAILEHVEGLRSWALRDAGLAAAARMDKDGMMSAIADQFAQLADWLRERGSDE